MLFKLHMNVHVYVIDSCYCRNQTCTFILYCLLYYICVRLYYSSVVNSYMYRYYIFHFYRDCLVYGDLTEVCNTSSKSTIFWVLMVNKLKIVLYESQCLIYFFDYMYFKGILIITIPKLAVFMKQKLNLKKNTTL